MSTSSACYAEPPLVALNLFHLRNGQIVDRREFFWEDQAEFDEPQFFSSLLKQIYLDQQFIPARDPRARGVRRPRGAGGAALARSASRKVEIRTPQRGQKKALLDLVGDQRQAQLRRALPRAEALVEGHPGSACRTR